MPTQNSGPDLVVTKEAALASLSTGGEIWSMINSHGNVDYENDQLRQIIDRLNADEITPNKAIADGWRLFNSKMDI